MTLGDALFANGLLEVGIFQQEGAQHSFRLHLDMLPAYPMFLNICVEHITDRLKPVSRIVCPPDSVPLGVAVSLHTKIPLVYSRGKGEAPVQDWVGAYDTGHPVTLICNLLPDHDIFVRWFQQLASVGLEVVQLIALVERTPLAVEVPGSSLIILREWLLSSPEMMPHGAAQAMLSELER